MTENKGKPSQQKPDQRKERETTSDSTSARQVHRLDRSRGDEKGGAGASIKSTANAARATQRNRKNGAHTAR
jgi:hypothetical protein